jgi:hypothetical protein
MIKVSLKYIPVVSTYSTLNLITEDTMFYIQHTAAVMYLIYNFNLISYHIRTCIFHICLYRKLPFKVRDLRPLIAAAELYFYFLHVQPDDTLLYLLGYLPTYLLTYYLLTYSPTH